MALDLRSRVAAATPSRRCGASRLLPARPSCARAPRRCVGAPAAAEAVEAATEGMAAAIEAATEAVVPPQQDEQEQQEQEQEQEQEQQEQRAAAAAALPPSEEAAGSPGGDDAPPAERGGYPAVRVSARSNTTAVAGYLLRVLTPATPAACLEVLGAPACLAALKALAKLQTFVQEKGPAGACVTFKPQAAAFRPEPGADEREGERLPIAALLLHVRLSPAADWPPGALDGADDEQQRQQRRQQQDQERWQPQQQLPMRVKADDAAEERERVKRHALLRAGADEGASFLVAGPQGIAAACARVLLQGLSAARKDATLGRAAPRAARGSGSGSDDGEGGDVAEPFDLVCTLCATDYTVERRQEQDQQQQEEEGQEVKGSTAEGAPPAREGSSSSSSTSAGADGTEVGAGGGDEGAAGRGPAVRKRIIVSMQRCEASNKDKRRAARQQGRSSSSSSSSSSRGTAGVGGAAGGSRRQGGAQPGFIQVSEDEWNQLKEQLEVVPHLTEQLQIMTRQHEQLLSLLAAQQQQQEQQQQQQPAAAEAAASQSQGKPQEQPAEP